MKHSIKTLLHLFCLLVIFSGTALGQETKDFPNKVALGVIAPLGSGEGVVTPVIFWRHQSGDYPGNAKLKAQLFTSTLTGAMEHEISPAFSAGYSLGGTVMSEGLGSDLFVNGEHAESLLFKGTSLFYQLFGNYSLPNQWRVRLEYENRQRWFAKDKKTISESILPENHTLHRFNLQMTHDGSFIVEEGELTVTLSKGTRSGWKEWSLNRSDENYEAFLREQVNWEIPHQWSDQSKGTLTLNLAVGQNLDLLSGYRVGGLAGEFSVSGYFRNEFRVENTVVANYKHEVAFEEDRKLFLSCDLATFKRLDLDYLNNTPERQQIAGVGVGYFYGIRGLKGLPIIVQYGEGLNVHSDSKESHRRELSLVVAGAF